MKEMNDYIKMGLLRETITKKVHEDPNAHEKLFGEIEKGVMDSLNLWLVISKPENVITSETKDFIEALKKSIYLTIKNYDQNNGKG